jgi:hypothetical protein
MKFNCFSLANRRYHHMDLPKVCLRFCCILHICQLLGFVCRYSHTTGDSLPQHKNQNILHERVTVPLTFASPCFSAQKNANKRTCKSTTFQAAQVGCCCSMKHCPIPTPISPYPPSFPSVFLDMWVFRWFRFGSTIFSNKPKASMLRFILILITATVFQSSHAAEFVLGQDFLGLWSGTPEFTIVGSGSDLMTFGVSQGPNGDYLFQDSIVVDHSNVGWQRFYIEGSGESAGTLW